jgi:hypothetical protein
LAAVAGAALPVLLLGLLCLVQLRGSSRLVTWRGGGGESYDFSQQSRGGGGEEDAEPKAAAPAAAAAAPAAPNLWDGSPSLPPWMKEYFGWHRAERGRLTRGNWETRRYLVLRCLEDDAECGGASDRLGPLPYLLMLAHRARRLLFIHWSRPAPLEEFLVPPAGGMDWTVPECVRFNLTGAAGSLALAKANATCPRQGQRHVDRRRARERRGCGLWKPHRGAGEIPGPVGRGLGEDPRRRVRRLRAGTAFAARGGFQRL